MEVSKWKRRRFTPTWGDNHLEDEPCVIVYAPPSVGWMSRWREIAMGAPSITPESLQEDGFADKIGTWSSDVGGFRDELLDDLILAVESLTLDGKSIDLSTAIDFIKDNEGLRDEVFAAILAEGALTKPEGKD
jgi:hypothetical protein